jgi:hypothetical protein
MVMPETKTTPQKCFTCDKLYRKRTDSHCRVCQTLEFDERILCELNWAVQDGLIWDKTYFCETLG